MKKNCSIFHVFGKLVAVSLLNSVCADLARELKHIYGQFLDDKPTKKDFGWH